MSFKRKKNASLIVCCILAAVCLTGCGSSTEHIDAGMKFVKELNYRDALSEFAQAQEAGENIRLIARGQGIAHMGLTEYEQAITCFETALSASNGIVKPIDFDINYYLAAAYTKAGQYLSAKEIYDAILDMRAGEKNAYYLRGCALLQLDDYAGAKADFDKVLELDAKNYDRLIEIYQALEEFGYKEIGQTYLQTALANGESKMKAYDKGRIYYYMGEYQKAYIALEEAREDGNAESYLYLGKSYEATGDYNYAASVYSSYLSKDPENPEVYNQLGLCEMAKKDYQKALEAFQAGMQIEENEIMQTLSFNEIVAYEYLGEYKKAAVLLDGYLKLYPDDETAKREQQFLSTR